MKKLYIALLISINFIAASLVYAESVSSSVPISNNKSTCIPGNFKSSQGYDATMWYRDSAEKVALYNQAFALGLEKIKAKVNSDHLKSGKWGIILDIDKTVLDNTELQKRLVMSCNKFSESTRYNFMEEEVSVATPGASNLTCSVQKLGGKVSLISNRNGSFDDKILKATIANLKKANICFDNVILAKNQKDDDKNPRFEAVATGNYDGLISYSKLSPLKVIAYFGDNIQDFPKIKQVDAIKQDPNGEFYKKFGQEYFSLPNPTYGSWQRNQFN